MSRLTAFWLWVYVIKHYVLAGWYRARSETMFARWADDDKAKAYKKLGDIVWKKFLEE